MKKICFIAQFPPPMHGLSKAVETLYNSNLNFEIDSQGEFEFEKVDITNNKNFIKNLLKISRSKADLFYFTISQTKGGNLRDLVIFKLLELQHKKCLIHLHNTNAFAMLFAEKVLTTPGMLDSLITKFNGGRKYLVDSLDKNGYRHKGEAGNFIFIEPKTDAQTVVDRMKAEKKILIKAYPNVGEFGNCLRVSIGEEKYMKQFMDALLEIDQ